MIVAQLVKFLSVYGNQRVVIMFIKSPPTGCFPHPVHVVSSCYLRSIFVSHMLGVNQVERV